MGRAANRLTTKQKISLISIVIAIIISLVVYIYSTYFSDKENISDTDTQTTTLYEEGEVSEPKYTYHFIDVGQGDSTLIISDTGSVLIDAGPGDHDLLTLEYIGNVTDSIDYMVITHPHEDHIGTAEEIITNFNVKNIIMPNVSVGTVVFTKMLDAIELKGCNVYEAIPGDVYNSGDIRIDILGSAVTDDDNLNNVSVFTKITTGEVTAMFTGDAEKKAENAILKMYSDEMLDADIFHAGHHGSTTSNTEKFLKAVSPRYAVISCGRGNEYGHPHYEIVDLFESLGIIQYRTDTMGSIVFVTDGKNINISGSYT